MEYQKTELNLIPYPRQVEVLQGDLSLKPGVRVEVPYGQEAAAAFMDTVRRLCGTELAPDADGLRLAADAALGAGEYRLECGEEAVLFSADVQGLCYGLATVLQLLSAEGSLSLPRVKISDSPGRDWRGVMMHLGGNWREYETILRFVDICYFLKLRYLHLHLSDNKLYTLPSVHFPELSLPGRHYSKEQLHELNAYAKARGVILIPEIDLPGHATSIVKNSRAFGGPGHQYTVCVGRKDFRENMDALIGEVCDLFPDSPYIHVGGDEVSTDEWENCPACAQSRKDNGLAGVGEQYSHVVGELARLVLERGRVPIVWEGFPPQGAHCIPKETIVEVFECVYHMPQDLLDAGFRIVNTSWKPLYLTDYYSWPDVDIIGWDLFLWQNWASFSRAYPHGLRIEPNDGLLGAQVCSWCGSYEIEMPATAFAAAAMAERLWTLEDVYGSMDYERRRKALTERIKTLCALD